MSKKFDEMSAWYNTLSKGEQSVLRSTARVQLQAEVGEDGEIGSSDVSCRVFDLYESFKRSGSDSIVSYCIDNINR